MSRRQEYKKNTLDPRFVKTLNSIPGWVWDVVKSDFQFGLAKLNEYVDENGSAKVRTNFVDENGFRLGGWVAERRTAYRRGKLEAEMIRELEKVKGWVWNTRTKF